MKKICKITYILTSIVCFSLTSCGGDDSAVFGGGGGGGGGKNNQELVRILTSHKWYKSWIGDGTELSYGFDWDEGTETFYFYDDTQGVLHWTYKDHDSYFGTDRSSGNNYFTYTIEGNKAVLNIAYIEEEDKIEYKERELVIYDNYLLQGDDMYNSMSLTSDDYTLMHTFITEFLELHSDKSGNVGNIQYYYEAINKKLTISGKGNMQNYSSADSGQPWNSWNVEKIVIEDGITSIGDYAFCGIKTEVSDITLANSIKTIGNHAFEGLIGETWLTIPSATTDIGEYAFASIGLKYLRFADSAPNLKNIGSYAFAYNNIDVLNITLPENLKNIGDFAFYGSKVKEIILNEKLETIGDNNFDGISKPVIIPNSVKSIGSFAFCGTFSQIILGKGVEQMDDCPFNGSSRIGDMYIHRSIPPTIPGSGLVMPGANMTFDNNWTLHVPKGKIAQYSGYPWKYFKKIIDDIEDTSTYMNGDGSLTNPFTVVGAAQEAGKLAVGEISTNNYYIKGKISSIKYTFSEQYGVATFHIYDGVTKTNQFYIYGTKYLGNRNWITGDNQIKIDDDVIIYGKLTNYNGILETADRENYIYSLNGKIN